MTEKKKTENKEIPNDDFDEMLETRKLDAARGGATPNQTPEEYLPGQSPNTDIEMDPV